MQCDRIGGDAFEGVHGVEPSGRDVEVASTEEIHSQVFIPLLSGETEGI